jgi:hypothetical protein
VTRIDLGAVSLVELRGHERQATERLGQWKTRHAVRKVIDASPAAITLALLLTGEELDSLEKRAGDGEIARGGRPGGSNVASPQSAARHGEPAQVFPATAGDRGWMAGSSGVGDAAIRTAIVMRNGNREKWVEAVALVGRVG